MDFEKNCEKSDEKRCLKTKHHIKRSKFIKCNQPSLSEISDIKGNLEILFSDN